MKERKIQGRVSIPRIGLVISADPSQKFVVVNSSRTLFQKVISGHASVVWNSVFMYLGITAHMEIPGVYRPRQEMGRFLEYLHDVDIS